MYGFVYEIGPADEVRQYVIEQDRVLIGRGSDCDITLNYSTVSRHHALITTRGGCQLTDLGAANVTTVNGVPVGRQPKLLADGDIIKVGACSLRYAAPADSAIQTLDPVVTAELATAVFTGHLADMLLSVPAESLTADAGTDAAVSVVLAKHGEPCMLVREEGRTQEFSLRDPPWTIGRAATCHIRVNDPKTSREHARLETSGDRFMLRDLGSANGTLVNGLLTRECVLEEGDTIRIGQAVLVLRTASAGRIDAHPVNGKRRVPVVVVPGLCGSELYKGTVRIWPNLLRSISCSDEDLAEYWGELTARRVTRETVVVPGLVKMEAFGRLVDFLCAELGYTEGRDLLEFAYDWRQDNRANAAILKERVASWRRSLVDPHARIVFIAHSMGGLLCRYYLEHLGGLDCCARLILLGTPNRGTTRIFSTAISGRGALALPIGAARVKKMMLHFPSVYQLMPTFPSVRLEGGGSFLPYTDDGWLPAEFRGSLSSGLAFRTALTRSERVNVPTTCVFGYGQRTLVELFVRRERDGSFKALAESFDEVGDDAVIEGSAVLDRAEIHPVQQRHGALYADKDVQRRLRYELLERRA